MNSTHLLVYPFGSLTIFSIFIITLLTSSNFSVVPHANGFCNPYPSNSTYGKWFGNDGGTYYISFNTETGKAWWIGSDTFNENSFFTNVFSGTIDKESHPCTVSGNWVDVPMGETQNSGQIKLEYAPLFGPGGGHLVWWITEKTGGFGGTYLWTYACQGSNGPCKNASPLTIDYDSTRDTDGDRIIDVNDNCPDKPNTSQADVNGNGIGNLCDIEIRDQDFIDSDSDFSYEVRDNCPGTFNPNQRDTDRDGIGDACDHI